MLMEFVIGLGVGALVGVMAGVWLMGRHTAELVRSHEPPERRTLAMLMTRCHEAHRYLSIDVTAHRRKPRATLALGRYPMANAYDTSGANTVMIEGPYWQTVEAAHSLLDDWANAEL